MCFLYYDICIVRYDTLHIQVNQLRDELDEAVSNQDFMKAQTIKTQMDMLEVSQAQLQEEMAALGEAPSHPTPAQLSPDQPVNLDLSEPEVQDNPGVTLKCLKLLVSTLQVLK